MTDPVVDADNDCGMIGQQVAALRRFRGAFLRRSGWKLGDVSFGEDYEPVHTGVSTIEGRASAPNERA